ncbi:C40 family peptidase [Cohnella faecalis]|nr:SH3 domain-containing C40 family peptidase [Cohnella faecalis]
MRRQIAIALAALSLLLTVPSITAAAAKNGSAVVVSSVSFRTAPSTSSSVMKYLKAGEKVVLLEQPNDYWYKVKDASGTIGYISSGEKYVNVVTPIQETAVGANAVAVGSVTFRTKPSTSGERIRYLKVGEPIVVTAREGAYWYAVTDANGVSGYVSNSSAYIKLTGTIPQPSQPSKPTADQQIEAVIAAGMRYLGTPYEYGSSRDNTATFDCSDFVRQAFFDGLNKLLPADSRQQGEFVRANGSVQTDWHQLKRGDLMFFMDYKGTKAASYTGKKPFSEKITHVAIYLGNGQMLHTYSVDSGGVRTNAIGGNHWEYRFLYGGSAL